MKRKLRRLHFVGIGGIGMAALAELLQARGFEVTGSDLREAETVTRLRRLGVPITVGHDVAAVSKADAVVHSAAVPRNDPELEAARAAGLPVVGRGALLADQMRLGHGVAIAGSHGKTTTTAMIGHVLEVAGLDPTVLVGGRVPRTDGDAGPTRIGQGDLFVAEVDESDGSFLLTRPVIAVVTNADPEHLDHYGSRSALLAAFAAFADSVPFYGVAILGLDHPGVAEIAPRLSARRVTYGFGTDCDLRVEGIGTTPGGQWARTRLPDGEPLEIELPLPGRHNVQNALAAIAVGLELGVAPGALARALASYPGVARRFERKGRARGVEIVDDYAHHPAELRAVLSAARSIHDGPVTAVFQPHRYTRTRDCWDDFTTAFADADRVVVCDVYAAGETPMPGVDAERLAAAIRHAGHPGVEAGGGLGDVVRSLPPRLRAGELVLTLGAGDVSSLGPALLRTLEEDPR